ncbi:nuclear transport factor 2 family protein [Microbispora triticiradicis]|uniref:Nuclear transport factor 2 family protein n=1 Tax=Microbispora triticiradicis TaxID=2200763 RepID=A0ABX9L978_9ACTN|nr:nuclear transport factor 2 family protein [Microbispora triticiradicis]RGA00425.1 nuclear transport factor 2 family protein [Microbispora triticiradicis]
MPDPREIHDAFAEALCTHDKRRLLDCFHADAVLVTPVGVVEGHEQIEWYFGQFFSTVPDLTTRVITISVCGDTVSVEWVTSGTQTGEMLLPDGTVIPGTGRPVFWRGCGMWSVEDGRFVTGRIYYDQLRAYMSLGCRLVQNKPPSATAAPDQEARPVPATHPSGQETRAEPRSNSIRRLLRGIFGM